MRKLLIAISSLAAAVAASVFAVSSPLPYLTSASGCNEASQLLNCINSQVYGLLNGTTAPANTTSLPFGAYGTATSANLNVTLNAQRGLLAFTSVGNIAAFANTTFVVTDSFVNAGSVCHATLQNVGATSAYTVGAAVPQAGGFNVVLNNATNAAGNQANVNIAFICY